jgi:hypothetical protein
LREAHEIKRSVFRESLGTAFVNDRCDILLAEEPLGAGFTVASAWAALRKCWKGLRIARNRTCDEDDARKFAMRIRYLQHLLDLSITDFPEFGLEGVQGAGRRPS